MTKMRVHELAKELGMENKELLDILQKKNVEVKNHMSTLEDGVADEIRREKGGAKPDNSTAGKNAEAKAGTGNTEGAKEAVKAEEAAPKKKNLAFVIRPQNSRDSKRIQGSRPAQRQTRPGQQGGRPGQCTRPAGEGRPM